jgi:hypothetical protein
VREHGRPDERVIRCVRQEVLVQGGRVGQRRGRLEPHHATRLRLRRVKGILRVDRPHLEGAGEERPLAKPRRQPITHRRRQLLLGHHAFGGRRRRHVVLVGEARLRHLEGGGHVEDRVPALDRAHAPGGERAAVADSIDVVDDGSAHVPRAEEIRVQRVHAPVLRHGLHRRGQGLSEHLPAEDGAPPEILALSSEEVLFQTLEREELHQVTEQARCHVVSGSHEGERWGQRARPASPPGGFAISRPPRRSRARRCPPRGGTSPDGRSRRSARGGPRPARRSCFRSASP